MFWRCCVESGEKFDLAKNRGSLHTSRAKENPVKKGHIRLLALKLSDEVEPYADADVLSARESQLSGSRVRQRSSDSTISHILLLHRWPNRAIISIHPTRFQHTFISRLISIYPRDTVGSRIESCAEWRVMRSFRDIYSERR